MKLRKAVSKDVPLILAFVKELAEYEREPNAVVATEDDLRRDGFGSDPKFQVVIAEWDGEPAGMALFFYNYSTWQGRRGLYIEDLYVRPRFRKKGIGKALMAYLAKTAIAEKCYGMKWEVLEWNKPAIDVYESLGSKFMKDRRPMQITGRELGELAELSQEENSMAGTDPNKS